MILDYILMFHYQDCLNILEEVDILGYFSLKIDFMKLFETYPDVGDKVLCSPIETLKVCDKDIVQAQQGILVKDLYKTDLAKLGFTSLKKNVHARFFGLPVCPELHRTIFPKNVDLGCFLKVTGTVVRVTQAKMLEYHRNYVCVKCKHENIVEADFENRYVLKAPTKCGNEQTKCKSSTFTQVNMVSREHCKDYQEIKIQEQVNKLNIGTIPGSIWVILEDDIVDNCKPGDDVNICGTVRRRWRPSISSKKCEVDLAIQANHIEVCNAQKSKVASSAPDVKDCFDEYWEKFHGCPLKGRDQILASVCPQVYGLHLVKLALLLTVITGSNHVMESEEKNTSVDEKHTTRVRGQCHLLLVGDPGTGKSQLLRAGTELTPRAVLTSGAGSTRAGLTCSALREDGEWQLEAGALVLSDGGVCCIDEIGQLREHDRASIHEAMEQQTISIAKAGIVCKLNTRCAIIAACNPKGHYDTDQPLSVNVSLGTPLLSRFDLIFILLDSKNKTWDKLVSSYILFGDSYTVQTKTKWNLEKLQMYISLVGPKATGMTKSANIIIQTYYMLQRKSDNRDPSRTTVRMLDSLVRLSQAHCRLMYRTTILPIDAINAVSLVDLSMQDCTLNDTVDALHSTVPKYPDFNYLCVAKKLLSRLNLLEIWQAELLYYAKILQVDHKTLENQIETGRSQLFSKFDDVTDENAPLTSTLITSSYFKKENKCVRDTGIELEKDKEIVVEQKDVEKKLAVTLKKHAKLNPNNSNPLVLKQKTTRRKRRECVVNTELLNKKTKKAKQKRVKKGSSCSEEEDVRNILRAVPSVNDVFCDLDIEFNFATNQKCEVDEEIDLFCTEERKRCKDRNQKHYLKRTVAASCSLDDNQRNEGETSKIELSIENYSTELNKIKKPDSNQLFDFMNSGPTTSRLDKLKQFQFVSKYNHNEYEYKKDQQKNNENKVDRADSEKSSVSSADKFIEKNESKPKSCPSSQISMFESSDCDIDLDII